MEKRKTTEMIYIPLPQDVKSRQQQNYNLWKSQTIDVIAESIRPKQVEQLKHRHIYPSRNK